jgi:DNA polymerase-1
MLMAHMVDENILSKDLNFLSKLYGGDPKRNEDLQQRIIKTFGWEYIPIPIIRPYGANDAFITAQLFVALYPDFREQGFDGPLWDMEQRLCRTLMDIEDAGVLIDQKLACSELERGLKIMAELENRLGFSPSSPIDLEKFLLGDLGLPIVKPTKGTKKFRRDKWKPSFDKEAMAYYDEILGLRDDQRAKDVLVYRGWQKTTSSNYRPYLDLLSSDGRLRPNFKQHGTRTGRLSCEKPNLQQIPRESANDWNGHLKTVFITEEGRTGYEFDYSQLEFRLGAAYAGELELLAAFNDPTRDVFDDMAGRLGLTRDRTKTLNYTLQFGGGAERVSRVFGVSPVAARAIINKYFADYPGLRKLTDEAASAASERGYVKYWTGRRRHFQFREEWRKAFNSVCQGGGFEIVKHAMVDIHESGLNNSECKMELQVHDSLRFNIENGKEHIYLPEIGRRMVAAGAKDKRLSVVRFDVECHKWGTKDKIDWMAA